MQALGPGEAFFTFLEVAMIIGVALAMPVIIYQVLSFVAPALYENEKQYLFIAVPGVTLSFAAGVVFCYFLMLPFSIAFLGGFQTDIFDQHWTAERYLDFVTTFMFWVGVTFELPIVMYFLSKMGVVSAQAHGQLPQVRLRAGLRHRRDHHADARSDQPDDRQPADLLAVRAGRASWRGSHDADNWAYHSGADWPEVEAAPGVVRRVLSCGDQMMVVQFRIQRAPKSRRTPIRTNRSATS